MSKEYFKKDLEIITASLESVQEAVFEQWVADVCDTLQAGKKVIISGVGKNYPICIKVADSMKSVGLQAYALHTYEALHGAMGMIADGDMVIVISKSGETKELITLAQRLQGKEYLLYLLSFSKQSTLANLISNQIIMELAHEGDLWNLLPSNSTAVTLILLQTMITQVTEKLHLDKTHDFLSHHPGGNIGEKYTHRYE